MTEGITTHCGCKRITSKGEEAIKNWLNKNNITYIQQYKINNCRNINPLPFDFAIVDDKLQVKCLIEFQGEQHYKPINYFGGKKDYLTRIKNDTIKKDYCLKNNIKLFIINYCENIDEKLKEIL